MTPRWLASSEARSGGREGTARSPEGWLRGRRGLVAGPARRPRLPRAPGPGLGREGLLAPHMGPENSPKRHTSPRPSSLAEASHVTAVAGEGRFLGPLWPPQRLSPHRAPGLSRALFLGLSRLRDTQVACSGRTSRRGGVSGRVATKSTHRAAQEIGGSQWAGTPPRPAESRCLSAAVAVAQGAEALPPLWGAVPRTFPPPGGSTRPRGRLPGELGTPRGGGGGPQGASTRPFS